jgi:tRNA(fMet)-specific endonuclease VapC
MSRELGVTEAQRNFSDVLNRIAYRGERFTLIRGGRPVAELTPVPPAAGLGDLPGLLDALPPLGEEEAATFLGELEGGRRDIQAPVADEPSGESAPRSGTETAAPDAAAVDAEPSPTPPAGRRFLLDATVLLDHQAGRLDPEARVRGREEADFRLSVITVGELFRAVQRTREPLRRSRRSAWAEAVAARLPLLPGDVPSARANAELWVRLMAQGTRIGPHDLWLAASCVAHGLTLATTNPERFEGLEGLDVEDWGSLPAA